MMSELKILTIIGARPQFMKAAAVSREIARRSGLREVVVHTGQHYDPNMSALFFEQLGMREPDYQLQSGAKSANAMIADILSGVDGIIEQEKPHLVMVYGDTNSTLAGALAAKKRGVPIAHVEAGVRNYVDSMPEEVNRYLTDRVSDLNFCVTDLGRQNLLAEGYESPCIASRVIVAGDVMYDLFKEEFARNQSTPLPFTDLLPKGQGDFILCTLHRPSNVDDPQTLGEIIRGLNQLHASVPLVMLAHPRTEGFLQRAQEPVHFIVTPPLGYTQTMAALSKSRAVVTDSGGLVREAYFAGKQSLLVFENPVWPEINEAHCSLNVPPNAARIVEGFARLKSLKSDFAGQIFGDGRAAARIVDAIVQHLQSTQKDAA